MAKVAAAAEHGYNQNLCFTALFLLANILLVLFCESPLAATQLNIPVERIVLNDQIHYIEDPDGDLTFEELLKGIEG